MEKQRKFLLVLPLLVIPFLTMAFWALGGGKAPAANRPAAKGLDISLPQAQFKKDQKADKLSVYKAVHKDSARGGVSPSFLKTMGMDAGKRDSARLKSVTERPVADQNAERLQAKLAQINRQISQPQQQTGYTAEAPGEQDTRQNVKQLRNMMRTMKSNPGEDPEMKQLSKMLTQIQTIQNPGSVKTSNKKPGDNSPFKAIPAVVDGKQKVMDGGVVKLRLTDSVTIRNQLLPKGQEIFGACQVTNQRLLLTIENIRLDKLIIPVGLTVFSLDGMPGIPAPEAELGGAAGTGADNAIQSMQILSTDQTLGAQAAAGGINAAKGLFSKKVKKIKVKLNDEYPVLLKINK
jgi:hypothetical protein